MLHPNIFSAVFSAIISVGLLEGFKNTTLKQVYLKTERFCAKIRLYLYVGQITKQNVFNDLSFKLQLTFLEGI